MGVGVFAHFDADIAASHFMRDSRHCPRAEETIENQIAGVAGKGEYALDQSFRFWCSKNLIASK